MKWEVLLLSMIVAGCEASVSIDMECELLVPPTPIDRARSAFFPGLVPETGELLVVAADFERTGGVGSTTADWDASYYDEGLATRLTSVRLGIGRLPLPSEWVWDDDGFHGVVIADPDLPESPGPPSLDVRLWTLPPPSLGLSPSSVPIDLAVRTTACAACSSVGPTGAYLSTEGFRTPGVVLSGGEPAFLVQGITAACDEELASSSRLFLVRSDPPGATQVEWGAETCDPFDFSRLAILPEAVGTPAGILLLFRQQLRPDAYPLHRVQLRQRGSELSAELPATRIGSEAPYGASGHLQAESIVLGDHLLFTDHSEDGNTCHRIRTASVDGSSSRLAPWQLPCASSPLVTTNVRLARLNESHAMVVWDEHNGETVGAPDDVGFEQGIFAAAINAHGQRASRIYRVSEELTGPSTGDFATGWIVESATDTAGRAAILFNSRASLYGMTLLCTPRSE